MKKLLLLAAIICSNISFGQTITLNEIDKFTKNKVIQVNASKSKKWSEFDDIAEKLFKTVYLSFKAINENNFLQLNAVTYSLTCLNEESNLILLFSDESTIELSNINKTDCKGQYQSLLGTYTVTIDQLEAFKTKELTEFRMYYSEGYVDYKVKKDKKKVIQESAELFLEEIKK